MSVTIAAHEAFKFSAETPLAEQVYGTQAVSDATGASLRQLQCWDQDGQVPATVNRKHKRLYSFDKALQIRAIILLKEKSFNLWRAGRIVRAVTREHGADLWDLECGADKRGWLLVDTLGAFELNDDPSRIVRRLKDWEHPIVAVDLSHEAHRLAERLANSGTVRQRAKGGSGNG
jgi:DNA-binding transcriptional MerR regulator